MTIGRKKLPPIVPQKKPELKGKRENIEHVHAQSSLESVVAELSLDTSYEIVKPRKNEPKPLMFDDLINDVPKLHKRVGSNIKTAEVSSKPAVKAEPMVKSKPLLKPKGEIKPAHQPRLSYKLVPDIGPKPVSRPKPKLTAKPKPTGNLSPSSTLSAQSSNEPSIRMKNTPIAEEGTGANPQGTIQLSQKQALLNDILQGQLKMVSAGQIPLMIPPSISKQESASNGFGLPLPSPSPTTSSSTSSLSLSSSVSHVTKSRSRGPKRKLPSAIATTSNIDTASLIRAKTTPDSTLVGRKVPPPVPSKSKKPIFLSLDNRVNTM